MKSAIFYPFALAIYSFSSSFAQQYSTPNPVPVVEEATLVIVGNTTTRMDGDVEDDVTELYIVPEEVLINGSDIYINETNSSLFENIEIYEIPEALLNGSSADISLSEANETIEEEIIDVSSENGHEDEIVLEEIIDNESSSSSATAAKPCQNSRRKRN